MWGKFLYFFIPHLLFSLCVTIIFWANKKKIFLFQTKETQIKLLFIRKNIKFVGSNKRFFIKYMYICTTQIGTYILYTLVTYIQKAQTHVLLTLNFYYFPFIYLFFWFYYFFVWQWGNSTTKHLGFYNKYINIYLFPATTK